MQFSYNKLGEKKVLIQKKKNENYQQVFIYVF